MIILYVKALVRNRQKFKIYFLSLLILIVILVTTLLIKNYVHYNLSLYINSEVNRTVYISGNVYSSGLVNILDNENIENISYNAYGELFIKDYKIYLNQVDNDFIQDDNNSLILYYTNEGFSDELISYLNSQEIFTKEIFGEENKIYANSNLSKYFIENGLVSSWKIILTFNNYENASEFVKEINVSECYIYQNNINTLEIISFNKLNNMLNIIFASELMVCIIIISIIIIHFLNEQCDDIILLKSLGFNSIKIFEIYILMLLALLTIIFSFDFVVIILIKYIILSLGSELFCIIRVKDLFLIYIILVFIIIFVLIMTFLYKLRNIKNLKEVKK